LPLGVLLFLPGPRQMFEQNGFYRDVAGGDILRSVLRDPVDRDDPFTVVIGRTSWASPGHSPAG